jgi:selenocysteine-specific elongation factor
LVGDFLVSTVALLDLSTRLLEELDRYHQAHPLSDGIPREEAREKIFSGTAQPVFEYVLEQLVGSKEIIARDRMALASHRISLSSSEIRARDVIERLFRDGGLKPPGTTALASAIEMPPEIVDRILQLLIRQKVLVRLNALVFHAAVLSQLKIDMAELKASSIGSTHVSVATFKERHGITRKYAIPLLEYLDRERLTRRVGDVRILL